MRITNLLIGVTLCLSLTSIDSLQIKEAIAQEADTNSQEETINNEDEVDSWVSKSPLIFIIALGFLYRWYRKSK